ncbi:hypothetical protein O1611_g7577 [Lasiodiplodia mahajangana]|uniref:Uncharacterized protein n=1 Tax=Lasiodiplodia mahajangana TaxID=1108764 RepID=A0ACC2JF85_9PEZI|nr:hypothetical protein O1611_g7577 [Lasiodiplodia mahajangana]
MDITDLRPRLTIEIPPWETAGSFSLGEREGEEGEYDPYDIKVMPMSPAESEATAIKLTPVSNGQIHQVCI